MRGVNSEMQRKAVPSTYTASGNRKQCGRASRGAAVVEPLITQFVDEAAAREQTARRATARHLSRS